MKAALKVEEKILSGLKKARLAKGFSQERLAQEVRVHTMTISLIERGKRHPTLLTLLRVCQALDIKLWEIIKEAE